MKKLLVANWKMNKTLNECKDFFKDFNQKYSGSREAWVAPQSIQLTECLKLARLSGVKIGAQNASEYNQGAYTGELSPKTLVDAGAGFVILGHSERRQYFKESSHQLNAKIKTALSAGLKVIYCVGETLSERETHQTFSVIADQLHQGLNDQHLISVENLIIAYEPVWAIGTGKTASPDQAQEVHAFIRKLLTEKYSTLGEQMRILYGGSVKPDNIEELLAKKDIDGGLVGGASLKSSDFLALCGDK
jgi:triosephosphate isomerase